MTTEQQQQEKPGAMNPEQAADLATLTAAAEGQPAAPGAPGQATPQQEKKIDLAADLAAMIGLATTTLGPIFPSLPAIYTPEVTQAASAAAAAVCDKHGWLQEGIGGKYETEIAAAMVLGPLAVATYAGLKGDIAANKAKAKKKDGAQPEQAHQAHQGTGENSPHVVVGGNIVATAGA